MAIPAELQSALDLALRAVNEHPQHDLNLGYRQLVYARLGPKAESPQVLPKNVGHRRRARLAIDLIRSVMPMWEQAVRDDAPLRALALSDDVLRGAVATERALEERDELWVHCDDISNEHEELQIILGVAYGAVQALTVALIDEEFDPDDIDLERTDQDVDPEEMDSAFFASAAYSNGPVWVESSDPGRRRDLWHWWINDAVPRAWSSEH